MNTYQFTALVLMLIGPALALARMARLPPSLTLFGLGVGSTFIPGVPRTPVDPDLVLTLFLPPILYASTVRVSWRLLGFTLATGVVLGSLLAAATVAVVAVASRHLLLPGLSWTSAVLLGAVTAIFDTRLFHEARGRPHVPRAIADTLKARELVGRLIVLATVSLAVEDGTRQGISVPAALEHYLFDIPAGAAVGAAVGAVVAFARRRIDPAPVEIAVSIAAPYAAALGAEVAGVSAAASIITAALVVNALRIDRRTGGVISSAETRVSATAFWEEINLLASSALFFLAGRALVEALGGLGDWPVWRLAGATAALLLLVLVVQFAFAYAATWLKPVAQAIAGRAGPAGRPPRAATAAAMTWSSTRSAIGLVIALSVPSRLADGGPFPDRDLILATAALVILGSVLLQGLTLRAVVARAGLGDEAENERERGLAREAMEGALGASPVGRDFDAARKALVGLRERDRIGDETLTAMLRETDFAARVEEADALPGAGPPNP